MHSDISYIGEPMQLSEDFIDVGYMAEDIHAQRLNKEALHVKRFPKDASLSVFFSIPNTQKEFLKELLKLDAFLSALQIDFHAYVFFDQKYEELDKLEKLLHSFTIAIDHEDDFGLMYGTQILNGTLKNKLTKSLFIISKDGAVFYMDMPQKLEESIDFERLHVELNKAFVIYNGEGCHG